MKTKFLKIIHYIWTHLFASFVIVAILFLAFFSNHSYWELHKLKNTEKDLRREIRHFQDSINHYQQDIQERSGDADKLEHFAREKMGMKRPNEDVFIIED